MTQYLLAIWDYEAEGEFELSFKQGDIIKLLEKHNEDWWEGEINEEIGFFPANRIRVNTPEDTDQHKNQEIAVENGPPALPPRKQSLQPDTVPIPKFTESTPTNDVIESPLPQGWEHAYAENGTIYYFNEFTGQSRWDKPTDNEEEDEEDDGPPRDESMETFIQGLQPEELKKLEFNQLQPEWIRHKGYIQMKMISEKKDSKLSSWKVYYAVLSNGFLLLYKEGHVKNKKSTKAQLPVGSFDLDSCKIDPAGKQDTKRKHVFIISTPKKVKLYVQTTSDKEFSSWLDAIMRELIARKERPNEDTEILRLLKSLTFDDSNMKVNKKMSKEEDTKKKTNWFSPKPVEKRDNFKKIESTYVYGQTQPSGKDDIFGGFLQMEEDGGIPLVLKLCITEVEKRGLESVGIYRLSGPASTIQKYRASFNNKETVSFKEEHDINAVTGLLKLYFRELRNPLMTHEYYEYFMEAARITDYEDRMYQIKSIIHSLPKPNYTVLEYLMRHLGLVASYSDINKMESSNLALIFSVGLLRSPQEDLSSIMMSDLQSKIVEAIIQQVDWFFEADEEGEQEEI